MRVILFHLQWARKGGGRGRSEVSWTHKVPASHCQLSVSVLLPLTLALSLSLSVLPRRVLFNFYAGRANIFACVSIDCQLPACVCVWECGVCVEVCVLQNDTLAAQMAAQRDGLRGAVKMTCIPMDSRPASALPLCHRLCHSGHFQGCRFSCHCCCLFFL